jgi:hypothetical protein
VIYARPLPGQHHGGMSAPCEPLREAHHGLPRMLPGEREKLPLQEVAASDNDAAKERRFDRGVPQVLHGSYPRLIR